MLDPLHNAGIFLINIIFDIYLLILTVRFILCWVRAEESNPVTKFVIRATQPLIAPLRVIIPTIKNVELSTLLLIILLAILKFFLVSLVVFGLPNILGLIILGLADTLKLIVNTFFYAIILQVILTWINQDLSPVGRMLTQLVSPIMRPLQRVIPPIGGIDISPIPALILLELIIITVVNFSFSVGLTIAFG